MDKLDVVSFRVHPDVLEEAKRCAEKEGCRLSEYLREAVRDKNSKEREKPGGLRWKATS